MNKHEGIFFKCSECDHQANIKGRLTILRANIKVLGIFVNSHAVIILLPLVHK